jgi:hypothetical protein
VLAADGAFLADRRFAALPPVLGTLLAEGFRRAVLDLLVKNCAIAEELHQHVLAWRHAGVSAHNAMRASAGRGRRSAQEARRLYAAHRCSTLKAAKDIQRAPQCCRAGVCTRAVTHAVEQIDKIKNSLSMNERGIQEITKRPSTEHVS